MIDEAIKHVTHSLNQTILKLDIGITNSEMTPSAGNTKTMNTPKIDNIRTKTIADKPLHDSTTAFPLARNVSLHPTNTDSNINATCIKLNQPLPPRENITTAFTMFKQTKQIIMDIDTISHANTPHNKLLKSLNINGLCKYDSLHKVYCKEAECKVAEWQVYLLQLYEGTTMHDITLLLTTQILPL